MQSHFHIVSTCLAASTFLTICSYNVLRAGVITEVEPNNSFENAQTLDGNFSREFDETIVRSTHDPHVTVMGTGDGTFDYYVFSTAMELAGLVVDIDQAFTGEGGEADLELFLFGPDGSILAENDDLDPRFTIDSGSLKRSDPRINHNFLPNTFQGQLVIGVGQYNSVGVNGGIEGAPISQGVTYQLHVSQSLAPEPSSLALCLSCVLAVGWYHNWRRDSGVG